MENEIRAIEENCNKLQINIQNLQNDFMTSKADNNSLEQQLGIEREKIKEMREETRIMMEQVSQSKNKLFCNI